jgi:hypothetical protein
MPPQSKKKRNMSNDHKNALAAGREQGRAVRTYLEALEDHKPKRGRKRTPESIDKRLVAIASEVTAADPLSRLLLLQEQKDLTAELAMFEVGFDMEAVEAEFIEVAAEYAERKGISYSVWRETGVPASVLRAAGIARAER